MATVANSRLEFQDVLFNDSLLPHTLVKIIDINFLPGIAGDLTDHDYLDIKIGGLTRAIILVSKLQNPAPASGGASVGVVNVLLNPLP